MNSLSTTGGGNYHHNSSSPPPTYRHALGLMTEITKDFTKASITAIAPSQLLEALRKKSITDASHQRICIRIASSVSSGKKLMELDMKRNKWIICSVGKGSAAVARPKSTAPVLATEPARRSLDMGHVCRYLLNIFRADGKQGSLVLNGQLGDYLKKNGVKDKQLRKRATDEAVSVGWLRPVPELPGREGFALLATEVELREYSQREQAALCPEKAVEEALDKLWARTGCEADPAKDVPRMRSYWMDELKPLGYNDKGQRRAIIAEGAKRGWLRLPVDPQETKPASDKRYLILTPHVKSFFQQLRAGLKTSEREEEMAITDLLRTKYPHRPLSHITALGAEVAPLTNVAQLSPSVAVSTPPALERSSYLNAAAPTKAAPAHSLPAPTAEPELRHHVCRYLLNIFRGNGKQGSLVLNGQLGDYLKENGVKEKQLRKRATDEAVSAGWLQRADQPKGGDGLVLLATEVELREYSQAALSAGKADPTPNPVAERAVAQPVLSSAVPKPPAIDSPLPRSSYLTAAPTKAVRAHSPTVGSIGKFSPEPELRHHVCRYLLKVFQGNGKQGSLVLKGQLCDFLKENDVQDKQLRQRAVDEAVSAGWLQRSDQPKGRDGFTLLATEVELREYSQRTQAALSADTEVLLDQDRQCRQQLGIESRADPTFSGESLSRDNNRNQERQQSSSSAPTPSFSKTQLKKLFALVWNPQRDVPLPLSEYFTEFVQLGLVSEKERELLVLAAMDYDFLRPVRDDRIMLPTGMKKRMEKRFLVCAMPNIHWTFIGALIRHFGVAGEGLIDADEDELYEVLQKTFPARPLGHLAGALDYAKTKGPRNVKIDVFDGDCLNNCKRLLTGGPHHEDFRSTVQSLASLLDLLLKKGLHDQNRRNFAASAQQFWKSLEFVAEDRFSAAVFYSGVALAVGLVDIGKICLEAPPVDSLQHSSSEVSSCGSPGASGEAEEVEEEEEEEEEKIQACPHSYLPATLVSEEVVSSLLYCALCGLEAEEDETESAIQYDVDSGMNLCDDCLREMKFCYEELVEAKEGVAHLVGEEAMETPENEDAVPCEDSFSSSSPSSTVASSSSSYMSRGHTKGKFSSLQKQVSHLQKENYGLQKQVSRLQEENCEVREMLNNVIQDLANLKRKCGS